MDRVRAIVVDNRMAGHETPDLEETEDPFERALGEVIDRVLRGEPMGDLSVYESAFCKVIERRNGLMQKNQVLQNALRPGGAGLV